jgi:ABC-type multidrug transport system ATPase subunit
MRAEIDTIEARGLSKLFGRVPALRKVDVQLGAGSPTLLVGANGSGKSTFLALLSTLLRPSTGELLYGGRAASAWGPALRAAIGFAAEQPFGYAELTGRENLLLRARLHRVPAAAERTDELLHELGLEGVSSRAVAGYSQGERRRLAVAGAFVHEPRVLLLDEPSSGLDSAGAEKLVELVRKAVGRGALVVVAVHDPWLGAELGGRALGLAAGEVLLDEPAPRDEDAFRALLGRSAS